MITQLPDNIVIFGSYLPAWIFCMLGGLLVSVASHLVLTRAALLAAIPLLPIFYLLLWLASSMAVWLAFFAEG